MGHVALSAPRPRGGALVARIIAAIAAALIPVFMLLVQLKIGDQKIKGWKEYHRIDVVTLILAVAIIALIVGSMFYIRAMMLSVAGALAFACFGLVIGFPMEFVSQPNSHGKIGIGAILAMLAALASGIAALAAASATKPEASGPAIGLARGASALNRQPAAPHGVPQPVQQSGPAPGWYPDPNQQARLRYFDGANWTDQTSN
ncbi:MAG: hypothetical protein QOJ07_1791 [Thermoleophilaceae bacterium]|nr:hypothetical protein [Thermoleophilaceae bacterium]